VLLAHRALSSAIAARAASTVAAASTSILAAVSFAIVSLAALATSLQSLPPLAYVPLPWQPQPPAGAARLRRPSAETVLQTWHASGGLLRGEEAAKRRDEQG
jgi:hypothetical protein